MAETNESFLGILNDYFSNIKDTQLVAGTTQRIVVPMEWIFAEKIDRAIIEKAFINLMCKANKSYRAKLKADKQFYGKVSCLEIERTESGVNLVINSRDGWTKIVVTGDKNLRGPFYSIDEDRLYDEILVEYNLKNVGQLCQEFDLNMEERAKLIAKLKETDSKNFRTGVVKAQMTRVAKNLTKYYDYMSKNKTKYEASRGAIQQRTDKGYRGAKKGSVRAPRKSDIYDFADREQILQEMNPCHIINIDKIESDNSVTKFAYVTYVYQNPRGRQGYLLVAEPFEGTHHTRVRFVSQEEFDALQVRPTQSKLVCLAENMTEMSSNEFDEAKFSKKFKHTSIEKFREKFRRIVLGESVENSAEEVRYAETDRILFDGERRKTKDNIKALIAGTTVTNMRRAREALYARTRAKTGEVQILQ